MKTSNKIIVITAIIIVFGLFLQSYIMRNAYQKALANPQSRFMKIDLKTPKYLNINHHWNVNFRQGEKFQIQILNEYKDLISYNYVGDSLNLEASNAGEMTVFTPKLPELKFETFQNSPNEGLEINFDKSFKTGSLIAKTKNYVYFKLDDCKFENVDINSKENIKLELENCNINSLNLNLPKHSEIELNYSNIGSKNFVLGDSCSVKITRQKFTGVLEGKHYSDAH